MNSQRCTIYLVRHGLSEANSMDVYGLDTGLATKGKEQIKKLAEKLKSVHFDAIFSSTLLRAKQSAEIIASKRRMPVIAIESLKERYYGVLEGKTGSVVKTQFKDLFHKRANLSYQERIKFKFSNDYESDEEVMDRFIPILRQIAKEYLGKTILIVGHVTAIKNLLLHLNYASHLELEGKAINNSGYIKIKSDGNDFIIERIVGRQKDELALKSG